MSGIFGLSIDSKIAQDKFLEDLFWGTFYQQHLGEEYAGLSTYHQERSKEKIKVRTHRGLFRSTFSQDLSNLEGTEGIGYCGLFREPFQVDSKIGHFVICFSGNIINRSELIKRFKDFGHTFERGDDVEVMAKLIAQGNGFVDGIKKMSQEIQGAYSLLMLTQEGIYAARSPDAHWSLVIGQKPGAAAVASESGSFSNLDFELIRDLKPGETILIKNGCWENQDIMPSQQVQFCSFVWVYTAFPNGVIEGIPASLVRRRLGACLAEQDITNGFLPDIVIPIPDSGRFHAIGYYQEFCRQMNEGKIQKLPLYDEILLKFPYAGRSFTPQDEEARRLEAHIKALKSGEDYQGQKVVVCDDSIVRGTMTQTNLVPKLRDSGVKEIHFRISNPELVSHCPWGKTTRKGETLAARLPAKEDRIKFLGVESLEYNTVENLVKAIGLPAEQLCLDCDILH